MPRSSALLRPFTTVAVALLAAGVLSACQTATPTSPSASNEFVASAAPGAPAAAAAHVTPGGLSVSWGCLTGSAFGSSGCPVPRARLSGAAAGGIITAAPAGLLRSVQGTTVSLLWGPPAGQSPTSYVVEAGSAPGLSNIAVFDTGSPATSLAVNDVPPGTYFVRVRGRDAAGTGPASGEVMVVVAGSPGPGPGPGSGACVGPGGAPTSLIATSIGSEVALNWSPPETCEPDSYLVVAGSTPGSNDLARVVTTAEARSFRVPSVAPGTYYVFVRGIVGGVSGPMSNVAPVTVTGVAPGNTSSWAGLAANGDGVSLPNDEDCGGLQLDFLGTLVQSGSSVTGIGTITVRVAAACPGFVGFTDTQPIAGTATGSLMNGSGTFTATLGMGDDSGTIVATFSNGRMTGTFLAEGTTGTFSINRQ